MKTGAGGGPRRVPRPPDGTVDLNGVWIGDGSLFDMEREGGLRPGDPCRWAYRAPRRTPLPHRPELHAQGGEAHNRVTIDDPGAYSKPFTVTFTARLSNTGDELMEYSCQENNQFGIACGHQNPFAK